MSSVEDVLDRLENKIELAQENLNGDEISQLVILYQTDKEHKERIEEIQHLDDSLYFRKVKQFINEQSNRAEKEAKVSPWRLPLNSKRPYRSPQGI